jgi:hypothetical protein
MHKDSLAQALPELKNNETNFKVSQSKGAHQHAVPREAAF